MDDTLEYRREILRKVKQIEIRTSHLVTDAMVGAYHSVFKGQGMDFEEVRAYAPGDEVRRIDWRVSARMNYPYVKQYREERELTIMLVVDVSASGVFGSVNQSKKQLAAEMASVLSLAAVKNNDKVGVLLFSDRVEKFIPPKKGRQHVLRLIREILFFKPEGKQTKMEEALAYVSKVLKRKSVVFLLSDFLVGELGGRKESKKSILSQMSVLNKKHDLNCIVLRDPNERQLPSVGIITLEDAETGALMEVDTMDKQVRRIFEENNKRRDEKLEGELKRKGIEYFWVSTAEHYIVPLRKFLNKCARRH